MTTLYLLFNHRLTPSQEQSAYDTLGVQKITYLPETMLDIWRHIPSEKPSIKDLLYPIYDYLCTTCQEGDYLLVQGDAGATFLIVQKALSQKLKPIYATTKRISSEKIIDGKILKTSIFEHIIYRKYGV